MIWTIAGRELRVLFLSPLAWTILAVVQVILGYMFLVQVDSYLIMQPDLAQLQNTPGVTDIVVSPMLGLAAIIMLMIMPLITMRVFADERKNRTLPLLLAAPVSSWQIVLGKYFGLLGFIAVLLGLILLMPLSLLSGADLDLGKLASGFIGMALLLAAFSAIGLFLSSLTQQPSVAAISTFGVLLMLWIIDWMGDSAGNSANLLQYLSILNHHQKLIEGIFDSADVVYYLLLITLFVILTVRRLEADRSPS